MPSLDVGEIWERRAGEELALNQRHLNHQLGRVLRTIGFDRSWRGAEGAHLIDAKGDRYLDMLGGYGAFGVGRNNPAVRAQLEATLAAETPNLPQMGVGLLAGVLAEQLLARAPASVGAAVLTNSGAESVETAIKIARAATGRPRIVYCENGFHGLSHGALSACGMEEFRERFGPLLEGFEAVPFGDLDSLAAELSRGDVAMFITEPVQGHGVVLPPSGYLEGAQKLCRETGTLFALDEVKTGLGRTGRFFALEHWALEPDLITVSKALSGGYVPAGATLASRSAFESLFDSMEHAAVHGSTFGNNDLAAAAGIATLSEIDDAGLVDHTRRMGELLLELTKPLEERYEIVREVRGLGLMWALELGPPSGGSSLRVWRMIEEREAGLAGQLVCIPLFSEHRILTQVSAAGVSVVSATPPLVIAEEDVRRFAAALDDVLRGAERLPLAAARLGLRMARNLARAR